ncbi:undecaprenyl-diphosphatase UppP [Candidatus Parcubacteria bacterium]|uniref:Undecaprenyl-diphosphatase n=1 Tax=Candidatus Kaiserbacteria bacterium CG10_big_fil_rev_8_21_14_0_10_47_16 TaxID=1974608 RepID=A0A2H0UD22_9BACT|nr:undecaprenyl-diphosphatase UppP [Candidatus Parcubacteria bacterium]PIR84292.1 MAG: undecaprenyl-diphosphatase UppP [Candidatus Kaiserbacteria bacterium CG10_big_fil_rev_8_21_14_0_10_47_16]
MDLFSVIILGLVQGLTEFLPVSSTGHLILFGNLLGSEDANALAFDAILHLATVAAIIVYFYSEIWVLFQTFLRVLGRQPVDQKNVTLLKALIIGTIPAVIFGLLLEKMMETVFRNPLLVAGVLVVGSGLFMFAEYRYLKKPPVPSTVMTVSMAIKIGFFQTLALIPGMSRSGSAISGGMILGLTRSESTRFAFLLGIPVLLGAGAKKLLDLLALNADISWPLVAVGAATAFIVGLFAIHFMIGFVRKHTLWPFVWYRIILAGVVVAAIFFGSL